MFNGTNYKSKVALLMGNSLPGCREDVDRLERILQKYDFSVIKKIDCYPKNEILALKNMGKEDLLYIHFSGHGQKRAICSEEKGEIVSAWLNPNGTVVTSYDIDKLISQINCRIILTTDCCNSERFGHFYTGKFPFLFIGTSQMNKISNSYFIGGKSPAGSLVCLYEYILEKNMELNVESIRKHFSQFFQMSKIKNCLIIREK